MKSYEFITQALSTLAAGTSIKTNLKIDGSREQGCTVDKIKYAVSFSDKVTAEGPLIYGICDSNLTIAELDEGLDSDPQGDQSVPEQEESMRKIVVLGQIGFDDLSSANAVTPHPYRHAKWFWDVKEGSGLQFFVRNLNVANPLSGSALVHFTAFITGSWLLD